MTDEPEKYCDLVMKGGITSGIVYPNAVLALARQFRFKNIGGTSAGAIAAAVSAAASMGDRRKRSGAETPRPAERVGFEGLKLASDQLATEGFIYGLFQPAHDLKVAYRLIVTLTGRGSASTKVFAILAGILASAPAETLIALALLLGLGFLVAGWGGVLAALVPSLVCAVLVAAAFGMMRIAGAARRNLLGVCSGLGQGAVSTGRAGLTDWLHSVLQELSGKADGDPLTFGDLWSADRYSNEPVSERAITLQMITTDVSHQEPRTLPFERSAFWFKRADFERLFPTSVVEWLVQRSGAPIRVGDEDYFEMPHAGDFPVLVATRMSLSFPLLISAVPLYEPVRAEGRSTTAEEGNLEEPAEKTLLSTADSLASGGREDKGTIEKFRVCWFSDGGIGSNFPIHLFDAALPRWPTFAINLVGSDDESDAHRRDVFLPTENSQGWQRVYHPIATPSATKEIVNFAGAIVATLQNWRDLLQSRAPGHRDRIAHVRLSAEQGGLNLNMPQPVLTAISQKGARAGEAFSAFSFENHYWVRWRTLAATLQRLTIQASNNARSPISAYANIYETARAGAPPPPSYRFRSADQQREAEHLMAQLVQQGDEWEDLSPDLSIGSPRPAPQLRNTPTY